MIRVSDLTKRRPEDAGRRRLFSVGAGEVVGFLAQRRRQVDDVARDRGLAPPSGQVTLGGFDVVEEPLAAKKMLGYMPETVPLYPDARRRVPRLSRRA
ncbi:MAG: hypothetical protein U0235_06000 [Polyangiaceae bacterium]